MNNFKFCFFFVLCLLCEFSRLQAQHIKINQQGEIFVTINNNHRPTDEISIDINNDHRPTDEISIDINNDHRPTNEISIDINNDHRIVKMDASGQKMASWQVDGVVKDMAIALNGNLYILLKNQPMILVYSTDGDLHHRIHLQKMASSIVIDRENTILLNIDKDNRIVRLNLEGEYIENWKY